MLTPRHSFGFAWLPATHYVYAIGSILGGQDALTATDRYNAWPKTWTKMAPLPEPRGYVQAAELNGKLYVVGGVDRVISDTYQVHNETWVHDPPGDAWSQAANFPSAPQPITSNGWAICPILRRTPTQAAITNGVIVWGAVCCPV